jgi:integrase
MSRLRISGATKREVERELNRRLAEPETFTPRSAQVTLSAFIPVWLSRIPVEGVDGDHGVKPKTKREYEYHARLAEPALGSMALDQILPSHVDRIVDQLGHSRKAREVVKVLGLIYKEAIRDRLVIRSPIESIRTVRYEPAHEKRILSDDEMQRILTAETDPVLCVFWAFLFATGARPWAEALPLTWDDLVQDEHGWSFPGKKTRKGRELRPIPSWLMPHLHALGSAGSLWPMTEDGKPWHHRTVAAKWEKVCEAAGVEPVWVYDLRATRITLLVEKGIALPIVAEVAGHANTSTTTRYYTRIRKKAAREAVE